MEPQGWKEPSSHLASDSAPWWGRSCRSAGFCRALCGFRRAFLSLKSSALHLPQLQELHHAGGDLMHRDDQGRTLLHHAVSTGSKEVVRYLLDHGEPALGPRQGESRALPGLADTSFPLPSSPLRDPRCCRGKVSIYRP